MKKLLFVIPCLIAQFVEGREDLHVLKLKEASANLVFQDPQPTAEMKSMIEKDINLILGHLVAIDVHPAPEGEKHFRVAGKDVLVEWMGDIRGEGRYTPNDFFPHLFFGYGKEGNRHLIVGSPLSDRYRNALGRMKMHEELRLFISALRGGKEPAAWLEERLWFHRSFPEDWREEAPKTLLASLKKFPQKWREPSMLDIHQISEHEGEDVELQGRWVSKSYYFDNKNSLQEGIPLIYDDGKWKFALAVPGT